jgi:hypothetical protein
MPPWTRPKATKRKKSSLFGPRHAHENRRHIKTLIHVWRREPLMEILYALNLRCKAIKAAYYVYRKFMPSRLCPSTMAYTTASN